MGQVNGNSSQLEKTKHTIQMQMFKERNIIRLARDLQFFYTQSTPIYIHVNMQSHVHVCTYHMHTSGPRGHRVTPLFGSNGDDLQTNICVHLAQCTFPWSAPCYLRYTSLICEWFEKTPELPANILSQVEPKNQY